MAQEKSSGGKSASAKSAQAASGSQGPQTVTKEVRQTEPTTDPGALGAQRLEQAAAPQASSSELKKAADLGVNIAAARGIPAAAGINYIPQEGDRTAVEKVQAQAKAQAGATDENVTLAEIASDLKGVQAAIAMIADLFARSFNVDFLNEASLGDVLSGEAAARGALAPFGEHPHLVDDAVIPPGFSNPTGETLPPNLPAGSTLQRDGSWKVPGELKKLIEA